MYLLMAMSDWSFQIVHVYIHWVFHIYFLLFFLFVCFFQFFFLSVCLLGGGFVVFFASCVCSK